MKNLKDIILEKLRVSKNYISKPELVGKNVVYCTMQFFFKWIMVLDPNKPLTLEDFEDFEVLEDDDLYRKFRNYEVFFNWYEENKDDIIAVTVKGELEEYENIFFYDGIKFLFYSADNFIDVAK